MLTRAHAQTHVYNNSESVGFQSVLFAPSDTNDRSKAHSNNKTIRATMLNQSIKSIM